MTKGKAIKGSLIRRILKILGFVSPIVLIALIIAGSKMPMEGREGKCTVCGLKILERTSNWLSQPITVVKNTPLSIYYEKIGLPAHEHRWEYLGGVTHSNFFSYPVKFDDERSDPFLLISDNFLIGILTRLETNDARIRFIEALNADDTKISETVRERLYEAYPGGVGGFMAWWSDFAATHEDSIFSGIFGPPADYVPVGEFPLSNGAETDIPPGTRK